VSLSDGAMLGTFEHTYVHGRGMAIWMKEKPQVRAVQLAGWILWDGVGESRLLRPVRAIPHRTPLGLSLSRSSHHDAGSQV